jgi:hypothetical protein
MSSQNPITDPPAGESGKHKPAGKLAAWLKTHRNEAILGGGSVVAVGIALWRRRATTSSAAAAPAGVTVPPDGTSAQTAGGVGFTPDDGSFDPMQQVVDLQSSINTLSNSDAAAAAAAQAQLQALGKAQRAQGRRLKKLAAKPPPKKQAAKKHDKRQPAHKRAWKPPAHHRRGISQGPNPPKRRA